MKLEVKKLDPEAKLPTRAYHDDAGLDFYTIEECTIAPGERRALRTGVAITIPSGYVGLFWDKSGLAGTSGLKTMGGVIDAMYRGEIWVILHNLSDTPYQVSMGSKLAQLLIQKIELPEVCEVSELGDTIRGEKGFGSSGTH